MQLINFLRYNFPVAEIHFSLEFMLSYVTNNKIFDKALHLRIKFHFPNSFNIFP